LLSYRERKVEIYENQPVIPLYKIDPGRLAPAITPVPLAKMVDLFASVDRVIVY